MLKIAVFNQKGGVGKTTTTLNLAGALGRAGEQPFLIDLDPQAHLTAVCGAAVPTGDESVYGLFRDSRPLSTLVRTSGSGWPIVPSHLDLSKVDTQFGKGPNVLNRLNLALQRDVPPTGTTVLVDCSPMLGVLSLNALFAADRVLVPVSADYLATKGVVQVERTLRALEQVLHRRIPRRYVLTRFDARRRMSWDIHESLAERFGAELCRTRIAETVALAESPSFNRDVFTHAPGSRGAADYAALLAELRESGFLGVATAELEVAA